MRESGKRVGVLVVLTVFLTLVPAGLDAAAACSPRLFRELGPAPNHVQVAPPEVAPAEGAEGAAIPDETGEADSAPPETPPQPVETPPQPVTPPPPRCSFYYDMDHPVASRSTTISVFGAIREGGERWHAGVDIAAAKLSPVVAVRSGTVLEVNRNGQGDCCWIKIQHTDGWLSLYVHLNNDIAGTDSGDGVGIVRPLEVGDTVRRGQVIGYVGDSGNAEPGVPHLHFELRTRWGESVDPLPSIRRAAGRGVSAFAEMEDPPVGFSGPFADLDDSNAELLTLGVSLGMPLACDDFGLFFCGDSRADEETLRRWATALVTDRLDPSTWQMPTPVEDGPSLFADRERSLALDAYRQLLERDLLPAPAEHDIVEIERLIRLCSDVCPGFLTRRTVHDYLLSLEVAEISSDSIYLRSDVLACETASEDETIDRRQLLEMLLRAIGPLPSFSPADRPPCERLS